jgi:hypothetical protein
LSRINLDDFFRISMLEGHWRFDCRRTRASVVAVDEGLQEDLRCNGAAAGISNKVAQSTDAIVGHRSNGLLLLNPDRVDVAVVQAVVIVGDSCEQLV